MIVDIRDRLHAAPFEPFVIYTADGKKYPVEHPDFCAFRGTRVVVFTNDDQYVILPALLISGIRVLADGQTPR